jgi:acyl CoA:acetate/3-ketoacid CoA transferase
MLLIEIAPGLDLRKDVLDQMDFEPVIDGEPALMDSRIFLNGPMGLANGTGNRVVNLELLVPKEFKNL